MRWHEFEQAAPNISRIGKRLLYNPNRGEVGILATVDGSGGPCVAPVCPIFCEEGIYLSAGSHTPKVRHLESNGLYALHALVGADDLEFQITGTVRCVESSVEHDAVVAAIPFPSYDASDPIYELMIERALSVTWPEPSTRGIKEAWSEGH